MYIQYSSTVHRDHEGLGFLVPKYHPKISLIFTLWHLGRIGYKPKNVFRSTVNPSMKLTWIFYWLTYYYLLIPSDKCNLIMAIYLQAWFLHCSTSLRPEMCLFANRNSSKACIMVLPNSPLFSFVLNSFLHCHVGDDLLYARYGG